jgi:uncharacterized protein
MLHHGCRERGTRSLRKSRHLLAILFVLAVTGARRAEAIPTDELLNSLRPAADVNDYAGLLSPAEKEALEARCRQLREKTGAELAVVTLKSLEGGQIDDFANKLFARWGIGQKDKKNGLLLLVAMEERKSRIEVGYGLEPIIPDVLAGRILDHQLRPRFREQKFAEGLTAAVNALSELVEKGEPADRKALADEGQPGTTFTIIFLTGFVIVGSLIAGIGLGSRMAAIILFGLVFTGFPLLLGMAIAWPSAPLLQVPISLMTAALGYYLARHGGDFGGGTKKGSSKNSDWNWGGFGGIPSSGGSWSSGGGGFSQDWGGFGGGSSGGGGASSDW